MAPFSSVQKINIILSMTVGKGGKYGTLELFVLFSNLSEKKSIFNFLFLRFINIQLGLKLFITRWVRLPKLTFWINQMHFRTRDENIHQPPDIKHFKMLLHGINLVCKAFYPSLSTIVPLSLHWSFWVKCRIRCYFQF